ncbi:hypothetical protein GQ457_17G018980 [Hibiscus cannabinus]
MIPRAHDVAALSIKGNSAILNFPNLSDTLPHVFSDTQCPSRPDQSFPNGQIQLPITIFHFNIVIFIISIVCGFLDGVNFRVK